MLANKAPCLPRNPALFTALQTSQKHEIDLSASDCNISMVACLQAYRALLGALPGMLKASRGDCSPTMLVEDAVMDLSIIGLVFYYQCISNTLVSLVTEEVAEGACEIDYASWEQVKVGLRTLRFCSA